MFTEVEVAAMLTDIGTVREVNQIGQTARVQSPPPPSIITEERLDASCSPQPRLTSVINKFAIAT